MLTSLHYTASDDILQDALNLLPNISFRESINYPTNNFFYDAWEIKPIFKSTVWEKILKTLPLEFGEARIIVLKAGVCYQSHADIDDRYHLNLTGDQSYLINLETLEMIPQSVPGVWYEMNAAFRHSAANFGYLDRIQIVIRKLLNKNQLTNPIPINLRYTGKDKDRARFTFDDIVSPWLNNANKKGIISNFNYCQDIVCFDIEEFFLEELELLVYNNFIVEKNV